MSTLKTWLEGLKCQNVRDCELTFQTGLGNNGEHEKMTGCYYEQHGQPKFFLLGGLPKCTVRKMGNKTFGKCRVPVSQRSCCFQFKGDLQGHPQLTYKEWFVAGWWMPPEGTPEKTEGHPFGANSLIGCWEHDEPIDKHEPHTYERFTVEIVWKG